MIAMLTGKLVAKSPTTSVVDCGGVGYEVFHTPATAESMSSETVRLFIHTNVREDALQLFGFSTFEERGLFRELLKVNNVGPKLAISILSGISYNDLLQAVAAKDASRLQQIPGIGKKTADRLLVELSDRLKDLPQGLGSPSSERRMGASMEADIESVLLNLGYQRNEIQRALRSVHAKTENFDSQPLEVLVKTALKELTQVRSV